MENTTPIVFIHGAGIGGAGPYMFFLNKFKNNTLILVQMPNISGSHYQMVLPSLYNYTSAIKSLFREENITSYILMAHSLGTDIATSIINDTTKRLYPKKLILIDPICVPHHLDQTHYLPFMTLTEINTPVLNPFEKLINVFKLNLIIKDIWMQQVACRFLNSGADCIFRYQVCPTLFCFGGGDTIVPSNKICDYLKHNYTDLELFYYDGVNHGDFLINEAYAQALFNRINSFII